MGNMEDQLGTGNGRLSAFDCRLKAGLITTPLFQSPISNHQSSMKAIAGIADCRFSIAD
jgi:hypothetical protein